MRGILYMVAAIALLSTMDAMAKWLATHDVTVIQILALRSVVIIPLLMAVFAYRNQLHELKPVNTRAHVWRGAVGFLAPLCFFLGLVQVPMTDAVVVFFSSIFTITLLSIIFLGEKVGPHRWASIVVGFLGVLIVTGPQGGGQLLGYLLVFAGSTAYAILFISGRHLSSTESVPSLVFSYNLAVGIISLLLLPWYWQPLLADDYLLLLALALFAVAGHYTMTIAFASAEASVIAPFEYTGVLWAIVFDLMIWQVSPTLTTAIGAVIIIGSGLYIVYRERVQTALVQK